jgi:tRNA G18 (ribose-2'-O)-methylase SpoU
MLAFVDDPRDPRVLAYTDVREKDLASREGLFVAEGDNVLRVLLGPRSLYRARSVLIAEARAATRGELLDRAPPDVPVFVAKQAVMDAIVGFPIHRGILALGERGPPRPAPELLAGAKLALGLVGLANHDNVGGLFRNAAAFGAGAIVVDAQTCDPLYRKSIRVSVGGALIVPSARVDTGEDVLEALERAGFEVFAFSPQGALELGEVAPAPSSARRALVFGAEGPGLPAHLLARARTVRIAMAPGFDSLNVAVSAGIALHALLPSRP